MANLEGTCEECGAVDVIVARKRCFECYLGYKRGKVDAAEAAGTEVAKKGGADPYSVLFSPEWSSAKAWWLGATFGDGYNRFDAEHKALCFVSGDLDLVTNWRDVTGSKNQLHQRSEGCWDSTVADAALSAWVASLGMNGRKGDKLRWPDCIPAAYHADFLRGLWDTDGHVSVIPATRTKNPRIRCSFTSKSEALVDAIVALFPQLKKRNGMQTSGPYTGYVYSNAWATGQHARELLSIIYPPNTPVNLMCARKHKIANDYVTWYAAAVGKCTTCDRVVIAREQCQFCVRTKYNLQAICTECKDPARVVEVKGLCNTCYYRLRRQGLREGTIAQSTQRSRGSKISEFTTQLLTMSKTDAWIQLPPDQQVTVATEVLNHYLQNPPTLEQMVNAANWADPLLQIRIGALTVTGDLFENASSIGQQHCLEMVPHRYRASHGSAISVYEGFRKETRLKSAINLQLKSGDPVHIRGLTRALSMSLHGPTNFAPVVARQLVDDYCPQGGLVFDPCAGYGGRLIGTLASAKGASYTGIDPVGLTVEGDNRIAARLGLSTKASVFQGCVEDTPFPKADMVLTCPPYYHCENYGEEAEALLNRHGSYSGWLTGFMEPLLIKGIACAPILCICVGPFRPRLTPKSVDLAADVQTIADRLGLITERKIKWIQHGRKEGKFETIFVFRRPEVQILPAEPKLLDNNPPVEVK